VGKILNGPSGKLDSPFLPQAVAETEAIGHDYSSGVVAQVPRSG